MSAIGLFVVAGLLGAIPFGVLITRCLGLSDPRAGGSGNIGATNVVRTSGWGAGLLTLGGDILKGMAAVGVAAPLIAASLEGARSLAALAAVLGHMFSPFMGFRGGKGVATGLGVFALLMPGPTGWAAAVFLAAVALTRYISLGSILGAITIPLAGLLAGYPAGPSSAAALIAALIVWKHSGNIGRLARGEENRLGAKSL